MRHFSPTQSILSAYTELQVIKDELAPLIESLAARLNQEVVNSTLSPSMTATVSTPESHCSQLKVIAKFLRRYSRMAGLLEDI